MVQQDAGGSSQQGSLQLSPSVPSASSSSSGTGKQSMAAVFPRWWRLARIWYTGDQKWVAWGYSATVVALALVTTYFYVHISYAQRDFSTALSEKNAAGFYAAVRAFVVIIVIAAPLFSLTSWVEERLMLSWRAHLTRHFAQEYFDNRSFYQIQQRGDCCATFSSGSGSSTASTAAGGGIAGGIDNPDQRICDDVTSFVRSSVAIVLALLRKVFNCVAFAGVLWSTSGQLVVLLFFYAGLGTLVTTYVFGRVLTNLYFKQLAREADLRFSLVRVRENAEAIAFYRGEPSERRRVLGRLSTVIDVTNNRIRWGAFYDLWTSVYSYATILVPSLVTAPRYFRGEIEFGAISQASYAFSRIEQALSMIVMNLQALSGLAAGSERLDALLTAMEAAAAQQRAGNGGSAATAAATARLLGSGMGHDAIERRFDDADPQLGMALTCLCVTTPTGADLLCRELTMRLAQGQSLLIVGPSGCGKSSLLRAISGLWMSGSGVVVLPAPESSAFFLPQRAFMPLGTLRQQLTFPAGLQRELEPKPAPAAKSPAKAKPGSGGSKGHGHASDEEAGDTDQGDKEMAPLLAQGQASGGNVDASPAEEGVRAAATAAPDVTDEQLLALLDDVSLPDLAKRFGGLDAELDWSAVLSVGEQQRVAMLRLLLCAPRVAFLDEATSALDGPTEGRLYALLKKRVGCYVSVGHRMQLLQHHTHVLEAQGGGAWEMSSSTDYQRRLAQRTGLHL